MYTDFFSTIIYNSDSWDTWFSLIQVTQEDTHNISLIFKPSNNTLSKQTISAEELRTYYPEFQNPSFFESDYLDAINLYKDISALPNEDISEVQTSSFFSFELKSNNAKTPLFSSFPFVVNSSETQFIILDEFSASFNLPSFFGDVSLTYSAQNYSYETFDIFLDFKHSLNFVDVSQIDTYTLSPYLHFFNLPNGFINYYLYQNIGDAKTLVYSGYFPADTRGYLPLFQIGSFANSCNLVDIGWAILGLLHSNNTLYLESVLRELIYKFHYYKDNYNFSTLPSIIIRIDPIIITEDNYKFSSYSMCWLGLILLEFVKHNQNILYSNDTSFIESVMSLVDSFVNECLDALGNNLFIPEFKTNTYISSSVDYSASILLIIFLNEYLSVKFNEKLFVKFIKIKIAIDNYVKQSPSFFISKNATQSLAIYCLYYNLSSNYSYIAEELGETLGDKLLKSYLLESYNFTDSNFKTYYEEAYGELNSDKPDLISSTIYILKSKPFFFTKSTIINELSIEVKSRLDYFYSKVIAALPKQNTVWFKEDILSDRNNATRQLLQSSMLPLIEPLIISEYNLRGSYPNQALGGHLKQWATLLGINYNKYASENFVKDLIVKRLQYKNLLVLEDFENIESLELVKPSLPPGTYHLPFLFYDYNKVEKVGYHPIELSSLEDYISLFKFIILNENKFVYFTEDNTPYLINYFPFDILFEISQGTFAVISLNRVASNFIIKAPYDKIFNYSLIKHSLPIGINWSLDIIFNGTSINRTRSLLDT